VGMGMGVGVVDRFLYPHDVCARFTRLGPSV
jgi:hypothetical protein